jgi:cytoskeletal protein RodZ
MSKKLLIAVAICAVVYLSLGFGVLNKYVLKIGARGEEKTKQEQISEDIQKVTTQENAPIEDTSKLETTTQESTSEKPQENSSTYTKSTTPSSTKTEEVAETKPTQDKTKENTTKLDVNDILKSGGSSSESDEDLLGGIKK